MKYNLPLLFVLLLWHHNSFGQRKMKLNYDRLYKVELIDLETQQSFTEYIRLKRKFGLANGFQKKIVWEYSPNPNTDSTVVSELHKLVGEHDCAITTCTSDWSKQNKAFLYEKTGIIENRAKFWIHPPRSKYLRILEFTPFPYLNKSDSSYFDSIILGTGWGRFNGEKVTSTYSMEKYETHTVIRARSNSVLGDVQSIFIVDENGFSRMEHILFGKFRITLLIEDD